MKGHQHVSLIAVITPTAPHLLRQFHVQPPAEPNPEFLSPRTYIYEWFPSSYSHGHAIRNLEPPLVAVYHTVN